MRTNSSKVARRIVLATLFSVTSIFVGAVPAHANYLYPSGCSTWVPTDSWSSNCYLGYGYVDAANYVAGTQGILGVYGYYGGSRDGWWGPNTDGATQWFQDDHGLGADGVVGPGTWGSYRGHISYRFTVDQYWFYDAATSGDTRDDFYRNYRPQWEDPYGGHWFVVPNGCCGAIAFTSQQLNV